MTSLSFPLPFSARGPMRPTQAVLLLLLAQVAIGAGPLMVRQVDIGPADSAFWRLTIALLAWIGVMLWMRGRAVGGASLRPTVKVGALLLGAGAAFAADLTTYHFALMHTAIANATFLANLSPLLVALGAWALFREKPAARAASKANATRPPMGPSAWTLTTSDCLSASRTSSRNWWSRSGTTLVA